MADVERKIAYRQGFRSSDKLTEVLNTFVKTPRSSFVLFSEAAYKHTPLDALQYDDQANKSVAARTREINDKITELHAYSRELGARTVHISLPARGIEDNQGLLLRFSPLMQEAATYWKIIKEIRGEEEVPSNITRATEQSIYLGLTKRELTSRAGLKLAKQTLGYALGDPSRRYDFSVDNSPGVMKLDEGIWRPPKTPASSDHPDIIDDVI